MDVRAYLAERGALVDQFLDEALPPADREPTSLHAAMRHLIFPGGKRLRPVLTFAAAEAFGAPPERVLPFAAAVELIHTYSLVHDDLPCMDDDVLRRGRPTVHMVFGEAVAVLAGDALQSEAFSVLLTGGSDGEAEALLAVARDLAEAAGAAALIAVSIAGGARLAGATEARVQRFRRFGEAVGVAFQIADDLLDAEDEEPCSTVRVVGVEGARARAESLLDAALAEIEDLGEPAEPLRELARFAVRRDR